MAAFRILKFALRDRGRKSPGEAVCHLGVDGERYRNTPKKLAYLGELAISTWLSALGLCCCEAPGLNRCTVIFPELSTEHRADRIFGDDHGRAVPGPECARCGRHPGFLLWDLI